MKHLKFEDVTATYEDADGDEHDSTVRAAVVSAELAMIDYENSEGVRVKRRREVITRDGSAHKLNVGDVVVETEKPGVYDVHSADSWKLTGYGAERDTAEPAPDADTDADTEQVPTN